MEPTPQTQSTHAQPQDASLGELAATTQAKIDAAIIALESQAPANAVEAAQHSQIISLLKDASQSIAGGGDYAHVTAVMAEVTPLLASKSSELLDETIRDEDERITAAQRDAFLDFNEALDALDDRLDAREAAQMHLAPGTILQVALRDVDAARQNEGRLAEPQTMALGVAGENSSESS